MGVAEVKQDISIDGLVSEIADSSIKDLVLEVVNSKEPENVISYWCLYGMYDKDTIYKVLTVLINDKKQRERIGIGKERLNELLTEKVWSGEKFGFYKHKGVYIRYSSYMSAKDSSQSD